jgi:hypothetical protein
MNDWFHAATKLFSSGSEEIFFPIKNTEFNAEFYLIENETRRLLYFVDEN